MYKLRLVLALLLTFFQPSRMQCNLASPATHNLALKILKKVILHQDYRRCSLVDVTHQRLVCEIWDEADKTSLRRMTYGTRGSSGSCRGSSSRSMTSCPDGSFNLTCLPHHDDEAYTCACKSVKQPNSCTNTYQWDSEWRDTTSGRQGLFRQLCNQGNGECVATEYLFGVAHLVKYIPLPDESISATSQWNQAHAPKRVRIDDYFTESCAWVPLVVDENPYIQFDFPQTYTVLGVLIRARCDPPYNSQRVTKLIIQYFVNNTVWKYTTPRDVYPQYGRTATCSEYRESFTYFFEEAISSRYWKILPLEPLEDNAMKADFIGRV